MDYIVEEYTEYGIDYCINCSRQDSVLHALLFCTAICRSECEENETRVVSTLNNVFARLNVLSGI